MLRETAPEKNADAAQGRFSALCAMLDGMTADELKQARAEIEARLAEIGGRHERQDFQNAPCASEP